MTVNAYWTASGKRWANTRGRDREKGSRFSRENNGSVLICFDPPECTSNLSYISEKEKRFFLETREAEEKAAGERVSSDVGGTAGVY